MSMKSRYVFLKRLYPEYLFAFLSGTDIKFVGVDKMIIDRFCSNKNKLKWLQKKHINYLVIDNTSIAFKYDEKNNSQYEKYYYLCCLCNILDKYK